MKGKYRRRLMFYHLLIAANRVNMAFRRRVIQGEIHRKLVSSAVRGLVDGGTIEVRRRRRRVKKALGGGGGAPLWAVLSR